MPEVVLTLCSGSAGARAGTLTLGHFAAARWQRGETEQLPEMFVAGEGLARGARDVLGTLLHEAGAGLASTRQVQDTSRQGRYHNTRFRDLATEMGLEVSQAGSLGWSDTTVPGPTAAAYEPELTKHGPERAYRCHSGVTCRGYLRAAGTSAIPGRRDRHRARA